MWYVSITHIAEAVAGSVSGVLSSGCGMVVLDVNL